jgi:Domain of unknown function (DUF4157)
MTEGFAPRQNRPARPELTAFPGTAAPAPGHARETGPAGPEDLTQVPVHSGPGQPVPAVLREQFERVTRHAAGAARVHTGPAAQHAAETLQARALTVGRDIHFGPGQFQPGTPEGDHLLAHELTHVVQQRGAAPAPQPQLSSGERDGAAEIEADQVADAVLDDDELEAPVIAARPPAVSLAPKKKKKPKKAAKPKPITFSLFSTQFKAAVDAANVVTVTKTGKSDGGWAFTPAGPGQVHAERTLDRAEYVHASGKADALVERCTVSVPPGGPATHTKIVAELGNPPTLSVVLSGGMTAADRKSVTVNGATLTQLDLPAAAITFTPDDGDSIHLGLKGEAWVFTTLQPDPVPPATTAAPVSGFFHVGSFVPYRDKDTGVLMFGIDSPNKSPAALKKEIDDLADPSAPASRRITSDEAEMFKTVILIESDLAGVQTYDRGILSFGFAQWTASADLPRLLLKLDPTTFERYLGRYGLSVGTPVVQLDSFVRKFFGKDPRRVRVRNKHEGALFLNGKELVDQRLLDQAKKQGPALGALAAQASAAQADLDAAKPDLKSTDAAAKAAAVKATAAAKKKVVALRKTMAGLAGLKAVPDPSAQAGLLAKVATDGQAAANKLIADSASSEVMRGEEWALRFEMLGRSAGGQDAEIAELRANWSDVSSESTHGAGFTTLLPHLRGRSALLTSYLNSNRAARGVGLAVDKFKARKQQEAKAAAAAAAKAKRPPPTPTEADWKAFPWPQGDTRWTTLWTSQAIDDFEAIAIVEMTSFTTDPSRRQGIIKAQFP